MPEDRIDAETKMIKQCIQSIHGLEDRMSADLQREFDFVIEELGKRLPRPAIKSEICYECPNCHHEIFADIEDVFCFYCHECGQLVYHNTENP